MAYRDMNHTCCGNVPVGSASYGVPGVIQSTPYFPGTHQAFPAGGNHTGTQVIPPSIPMLPAAGSTTTSSSAPPQFPSIPGAIAAQTGTQFADQVPSTLQNTFFTPGFLRTQIGRRMRVEFLLGTNLLTDRTGTLVAVGASYIVLRLVDSDDLMMCDIFSIKFVTILL
ncbi:MAG TPA: hypothetical protein PLP87_10875 [Clostridiales bacterium]|nr:hypothetical protein [Clostridiales bacterium]